MLALGKKIGGGHAPIPLNADGTAVLAEATAGKTKLIEASVGAGTWLVSNLTWFGGDISTVQSLVFQANSSNAAAIQIGAPGGSGGISLGAGESAEIQGNPDPALVELRIGAGDAASLTAQVPA